MNKNQSEDNQPAKTAKSPSGKSFTTQLLSPAMGLALLGTVALIFSFYRAGQLTNLVISKDEIKKAKSKFVSFKDRPKVDINSPDILTAVDNSEPALLVIAGNYKQAVTEAMRDLTDNPPNYVPTILEAGDILSEFGDDKKLAFALLERAVGLAPSNQYIALRYAQRLINNGRIEEAEPKLVQLNQKYPQWADPLISLSKLRFLQGQTALAATELISLTNGKNLNSKEAEQVALMLAKLGRVTDGFVLFQKACSEEPQKSFYSSYCQDWLSKSPDSYETVLAMVKSNLSSNGSSVNSTKQLNLEIKHAALLMLLSRPQDAAGAIHQAISVYPNNFDLNILLAAAHLSMKQIPKAKVAFQNAADCYQPKF